MRRWLSVLALIVPVPFAIAQDDHPTSDIQTPRTVAEDSGFERTARFDDVVAFLEELDERSERVTLDVLGTTNEGRDIPLAIIADPPVRAPEDVGERLVVFMLGNIHAGEVCGKEALLMLARELALPDESPLLADLVVCLAPIYNADGNERFGPDNRPGQNGPSEMGIRANAQGLDLNRDHVKLEAPETRALVRFLNTWDPTVIVDTHTTNGSHHRYTITYQGPKHPAGDAEVIRYVRDEMLPAVDRSFEEETGYKAFFYGNFAGMHTRWTTYPAEPRYGVAYRGLRNRVSILSEAYAYASFEDRVLGTLGFCRSILEYGAEHRATLRELVSDADERTIEAGRNPESDNPVALRVEAVGLAEKAEALGFEEYDDAGDRVEPGDPKAYQVEVVNLFEPTESVERAWAYVIPSDLEHVAIHLQHHGVDVDVLREDMEIELQVYRLGASEVSQREFEGHRMVRSIRASAVPRTVRIEAGAYVVRTAQKLGSLASYLLEPRASDGLVAWNFLDGHLDAEELPILRLPDRTPLTTRGARPLSADRKTGKRVTFEARHGENPVNLSGSPVRGLRWLDEQTFVQTKEDERRRVHAVSGRSEPMALDTDAIGAGLSMLPTISVDDGKRIASRRFRAPVPDPHGVVFSHAGDLYHAASDGSAAARLTSSPEEEELSRLSPDGRFVAFVRDNDLWVVDIQTQTERALTTGGTDEHRNGKAAWVYYEELLGRSWHAFWWSPDSDAIAFLITDSSLVPGFTIVGDAPKPQRIERTRYPKPGQFNPRVEVGIVSPAGGPVRRVDLDAYDDGAFLISQVAWSDRGKLRLAVQDRAQTWMDLLDVPAKGGKPDRLFRERTEAWVEPQAPPHDLEDGSFLLASERDGWRHLYHFEEDGSLRARLTHGMWEVRTVHRVDEKGGWIYFDATRDNHLGMNLYRAPIGGIGEDGEKMERLTSGDGWHRITMSPEGSMFLDSWSSHDTPKRVELFSSEGVALRAIDTNPVYELEEYDLGRFEQVRIESERGVTLEGALLYPPGFDPARRYPVWFRTYAGPHAPTVRDTWADGRLFDQMLAEMGVVVFLADPYPASGKGAVSAWTAYKQLGVRELEDITELIGWLKGHDWVDPDRIGMSGHSYGGFMTSYAMTHSTLFSAGIAGAPVTSWRDYDSIYTERYMHTPQNNPEGYESTSVVDGAGDLHGRLLLLHGAMDDNVHIQNTIRLVDALQKADKDFEMFVYPGARHGIGGKHYDRAVYRFIAEAMRSPEPAPPEPERERSPGEELEAETDGAGS